MSSGRGSEVNEVEAGRLRTSIQRRSSLVLEESEEEEISDAAKNALGEYAATRMVALRHYCRHDAHRAENVVIINERGNLCQDLPFLALICCQILAKMWDWCFTAVSPDPQSQPSKDVEEQKQKALSGLRYQAKVKNFDFFPLYRFLQMLHRQQIHVQGKKVSITLCDDTMEDATCDSKYEKVHRLVEQHFLDDLPLWGCLTGLREEKGLGLTGKEEAMSKRAFWEWLYAVRQITAFYHLDRAKWLDASIKYLNRKEFVELAEEAEETWVWGKDDPEEEIVEFIIGFVAKAIEYACGYHGSWDYGQGDESSDEEYGRGRYSARYRRKGYFRYDEEAEKIAHEMEHAFVHLANQYCAHISELLKVALGDEMEEWDELEDDKVVPLGILL